MHRSDRRHLPLPTTRACPASHAASAGYCGRTEPAVLHARPAAAPRGAAGDDGTAQAHITRAMLAVLTTLTEQIKFLLRQVPVQPKAGQHPAELGAAARVSALIFAQGTLPQWPG